MRSDWRLLPCLLALTIAAPALAAQAPEEPLLAGSEDVPVPRRVTHIQPVYPPEAAARGLRGIVILSLIVDTQGRVEDVEVVRSVPPFDEAAIAAVRQWVYEPTEVDGRPVRVRVTVPISFLMKLPEVSRQEGIPELRSGAVPPFPSSTTQVEVVSAELSLGPDGQVAGAQVLDGNSPWSEALIAAVRTWRFDDNDLGAGVQMSFRVEAQFIPAGNGEQPRVALQLTGLRRSESRPADADLEAPAEPAAAAPEPEPPAPAIEEPTSEPMGDSFVTEPEPEAEADEPEAPVAPVAQADAPEPAADEAEAPEAEAPEAEAGEPAAEPPADDDGPETPQVATSEPATTPPGDSEPGEPEPVTEVLGGGLEPAAGQAVEQAIPAEPGVSSVRGVFLQPGVPDLAQGRRPAVPPFARMQGVEGSVRVRFAVDAAGQSFVSAVEGPEELRLAARATVESWLFSRQTASRLYLIAELSYDSSTATAEVRPER